MRTLLALLFRQLVRYLWPSREPPKTIVTAAEVTLLYANGHTEHYRPEQARQMGYEVEAHEAEVAWVEYWSPSMGIRQTKSGN